MNGTTTGKKRTGGKLRRLLRKREKERDDRFENIGNGNIGRSEKGRTGEEKPEDEMVEEV